MLSIKEESYLIDYIKSFELIAVKDEIKDNQTVLDKIIDIEYKEIIQKYANELMLDYNQSSIQYCIGENFNILFSIVKYYKLHTFKELSSCLLKLTINQLQDILSLELKIDKWSDLMIIEALPLSFKDKWHLAILLKEFSEIKLKMLKELDYYYAIYKRYADALYVKYADKINQVVKGLVEDDAIYTNVFKQYIDRSLFDSIKNRVVLLISINGLEIYNTKNYKLIAIGVYVVDFYLELNKQKQLDELDVIQILKLLADGTRYGIIKNIHRGITSNSILADMFSVSRAAISMQFKQLQANQIIVLDETTKHYIINKERIQKALESVQLELDLINTSNKKQ